MISKLKKFLAIKIIDFVNQYFEEKCTYNFFILNLFYNCSICKRLVEPFYNIMIEI